jgi:hypothetical protein
MKSLVIFVSNYVIQAHTLTSHSVKFGLGHPQTNFSSLWRVIKASQPNKPSLSCFYTYSGILFFYRTPGGAQVYSFRHPSFSPGILVWRSCSRRFDPGRGLFFTWPSSCTFFCQRIFPERVGFLHVAVWVLPSAAFVGSIPRD